MLVFKSFRAARIAYGGAQRAKRKIGSLRQKHLFLSGWPLDDPGAPRPEPRDRTKQGGFPTPGHSGNKNAFAAADLPCRIRYQLRPVAPANRHAFEVQLTFGMNTNLHGSDFTSSALGIL